MICYKITDRHMRTFSGCRWELGKWRKTSDTGGLCSSGLIHAYEHPLLAVLHDPIHGYYFEKSGARMFRCETRGKVTHDGQMKLGAREMRLLEEVEAPVLTPEQRVRYAILCAAEVTKSGNWWVGLDRTSESAEATSWAAAEEEWAKGASASSASAGAALAWEEKSAAAKKAAWANKAKKARAKVAWAAWAAEKVCKALKLPTREFDLISLAEISVSNDTKYK